MESFFPMSPLFKNEALNITALPHVQDVSVYAAEAFDELEVW
jgi:hypothetical protein